MVGDLEIKFDCASACEAVGRYFDRDVCTVNGDFVCGLRIADENSNRMIARS